MCRVGSVSCARTDDIISARMYNLLVFIHIMALCSVTRYILRDGFISGYHRPQIRLLWLMLSRLPENVTFAQGALLEPLSVVMHGISRTRLSLGRGVVVCGAGPIGLIALAAARASGAHPIVITDLEPKRLAFAKDFVPSCRPYQISRNLDAQGNAKVIRSLFGDSEYEAPETILECTGVESSVVTAAYTVRRGGDLMVIGVGKDIMNNLPFMHISLAEVGCTSFS